MQVISQQLLKGLFGAMLFLGFVSTLSAEQSINTQENNTQPQQEAHFHTQNKQDSSESNYDIDESSVNSSQESTQSNDTSSHSTDSLESSDSKESHALHTHQNTLTNKPHAHNDEHSHHFGDLGKFGNFRGSIGVFGKTSAFASERQKANKDSYSMLFATMIFSANPFSHYNNSADGIVAGLGASAFVPFGMDTGFSLQTGGHLQQNAYNYLNAKFVPNVAHLGYVKDFGLWKVDIKAGRFEEGFEWIWHSVQGAKASITRDFGGGNHINLYGLWANEQAHITREFSTDFDFYKQMYGRNNFFVLAGDIAYRGFVFTPYGYYMQEYFGVYGGKASYDIGFGKQFSKSPTNSTNTKETTSTHSWRSKTLVHYAFLYSNYARIHAGHNMMNHASSSNGHEQHTISGERGDSFLILAEQEFRFKENLAFGVGFQYIGKHFFEIANMGSTSRFETHAHSHDGFGVLQPGGMHNGSQMTNMYNSYTSTWYGFVNIGFNKTRFGQFALQAMGRDSRNSSTSQSQASIGLKYDIPYGFELGAVAVFMLEKQARQAELNRSYGKAYLRYSF